MKRYLTRVGVLLLASLLVSCGGGGGDAPSGGATTVSTGGGTPPASGGDTSPGTGGTPPATGGGDTPPATGGDTPPATGGDTPPATGGDTPPATGGGGTPPATGGGGTLPSAGVVVEETDRTVVTVSGVWLKSNATMGWSGGSAIRSNTTGSTVSFQFNGTSVRWIGSRSRDGGIAKVSIDGGAPKNVDTFNRSREIRTPVLTIYDLTPGPHTLTIEVTGLKHVNADSNFIVVDAFEVEPLIVSRLQETDPDVVFSGTWTQADKTDATGTTALSWSSCCVTTEPDPPAGGARVLETAGASATLTFSGTAVKWMGYRGPNGGIARVLLDGVALGEVDTYSPTQKFQEIVFTAGGLVDSQSKKYRLTVEATGRKNDAATAAQVVVDGFEVVTRGKRHEEDHPNIVYAGTWTPRNLNRAWSEGDANTSFEVGATATFTFTGSSVSWIGCRKASIGRARISIDGVPVHDLSQGVNQGIVNMRRAWPIEGYQNTIYRADGLAPGTHTITVEVLDTSAHVVDAFDVRP